MTPFVGRGGALARLLAARRASLAGPGPRRAGLVLVAGEAGIGKTALLGRFAAECAPAPVRWGTCWDDEQAPAWWPWTQALRDAGPPLFDHVAPAPEDPDAARTRVFLAVHDRLESAGPATVVLDDLQWADETSMSLLTFLLRQPRTTPLLLVGAYRPDELPTGRLAGLVPPAEQIVLGGLSAGEVTELVRSIAGETAAGRWGRAVHARSDGHPFFARELCHLLEAGGAPADVPAAVREVIGRRLARLPDDADLLDAAAVAGPVLRPDVLADVVDRPAAELDGRIGALLATGVLAGGGDEPVRFAHDLYRETICAALPGERRTMLHERTGWALLRRHERGGPVFPAELARHFAAAPARCGVEPVLTWAHAAAEADAGRFAFGAAAGHLRRARTAIADAGCHLPAAALVRLLTAEADLRLRAGDAATARALLDGAWRPAGADPDLLALVALGLDRVGARFAMPRTELIRALETARSALHDRGTAAEAQVTAALARQLQHSVPADRPRAGPYAERAVTIARTLDDPATLAGCLLARHDSLWTPGTGAERVVLAAGIVEAARAAGDPEREAQGLLLAANAHLENGSAAFRAVFAEFAYRTERLRQPRHDYLLRTRQAAIALLDGDLGAAERLVDEAAALGKAVGDRDTGNVRMSQRLELVRARSDPDELRRTAEESVRWWIGAPAHAHAVAAGFLARAGDLAAARREVDTVLALPDWRADRSYLWSVFAGELATGAIALDDQNLCRVLLADLEPLAATCTVNGALVCFMGAHAHRVGLLRAALGDATGAVASLRQALDIHKRLGARLWAAETGRALATLGLDDAAAIRRDAEMWRVSYHGRNACLRDSKGLRDLAILLARPGADVAAVELMAGGGPVVVDRLAAEPVLDATALRAYRKRLLDLDRDPAERQRLLAEVRRATRPDGTVRPLGADNAERARKAVAARIRDAIRRIDVVLPEFGRHLDRSVRTGHMCRYDG
ncbi:AAA family ATPase [Actinoplanes sp. LDG1-06]|uniref:AAA family ATPase n=1 Tax=Paractinoplanes ovalisporus TaxID=2810368 RepID=A0ABS2AB85_9ACTN|nr:AAA family ATPase [Actinoplanes ovalisporus]MBM2617058.1 AAA family ATPase [Actinoplanes ovalisporus]